MLGVMASVLLGCGTGEESSEPSGTIDTPVQVIARDALFSTLPSSDEFVVDLSSVVLKEQEDDAFYLSQVSLLSGDPSCQVSHIDGQTFSIVRKNAKVCDYSYQVAPTEQSKMMKSQQASAYNSSNPVGTASVRVVVSSNNSVELPPLSLPALINETGLSSDPAYRYQPVTFDLGDALNDIGVNTSGWDLSSTVAQPYAKGATVSVDVANQEITYTPAVGITGIDRLMYSYTDSSGNAAYSGVIDVAVTNNANQGIDLDQPDVLFDNGTGNGFVPLTDAGNGITIDVIDYITSLDGDDLQLISVHSLTAPLTDVDASKLNDPSNTEFVFNATTEMNHVITYVVTDHKGSYLIGHIIIPVVDASKMPTWQDITHPVAGTLFYAPKGLNEAVAKSYQFSELITSRVAGTNYSVAALNSLDVERYCSLMGAEVATTEEIKSLVDRGWTLTAGWPIGSEYIVKDRLSNSFRIVDISAAAYSIDTTLLSNPASATTAYFPACVVRGSTRMLTSLQFSATPPAGTTALSVPKGHSMTGLLTGYFNDGSVENDMVAYDSSETSFVQSNVIFNRSGNTFTGDSVGTTNVYGQYHAASDPLRSNILQMEVVNAVVIGGSISLSDNSVPLGAEIEITGTVLFSDNTTKTIQEIPTANITWLFNGNPSANQVDSILCGTTSCRLKASDTYTGNITVGWEIDGHVSSTQNLNVTSAVLLSLDRMTITDRIDTSIVTSSYPIGRDFVVTVDATYTNGTREVSTDSSATWSSHSAITRSGNIFTGTSSASSIPITFNLAGERISRNVEITPAYLISAQIQTSNFTLVRGSNRTLATQGTYSNGNTGSVNSVTGCSWASSNTSRASVSSSGQVLTTNTSSAGTVTITLRCTTPYTTLSDTVTVTVTEPAITNITLSLIGSTSSSGNTRTTIYSAQGETVSLRATATYNNNTTADITNTASWRSENSGSLSSLGGGQFRSPLNPQVNSVRVYVSLNGQSGSIQISQRRAIYANGTIYSELMSGGNSGNDDCGGHSVVGYSGTWYRPDRTGYTALANAHGSNAIIAYGGTVTPGVWTSTSVSPLFHYAFDLNAATSVSRRWNNWYYHLCRI